MTMIKLLVNGCLLRQFIFVIMICLSLLTSHAFAAGENGSGAGLAADSQNPIANLISVPFEWNSHFNLGEFDRTQKVLLIKPVYPL